MLGLVGLATLCHRAFVGPNIIPVGISWVQNIFFWIFRGSQIFFRGYFVGPNFFSRGYFLGLKIFLGGILWVQDFMIFNKLQ